MLGVSGMLGSSGDGPAPDAEARETCGSAGPNSGGGLNEEDKMKFEESERNSGGTRWPRQETLALLKIRLDMDAVFRDSSLKGPLWEEVSRKLGELGYHRNAKKCKEKFENLYKYHKRTKEGRSSKAEGKTYRFFDQLEALDQNQPSTQLAHLPPPPRPQNQGPESPIPVAMAMPTNTNIHPQIFPQLLTVSSTPPPPPPPNPSQNMVIAPSLSASISLSTNPQPPPPAPPVPAIRDSANLANNNTNLNSCLNQNSNMNFGYVSESSSTSSDEEEPPERRRKRKRKWEGFFQRLMNEVIEKQEEMQKKFLETLERRERDRAVRDEARRVEEMARMNREHELLVQERSMAAAKDAAVIAFLQKVSDQQVSNVGQIQMQMQMQVQPKQNNPIPPAVPPPQQPPPPSVKPLLPQQLQSPLPPPPQSLPQPQPQPQSQLQKSDNPKTDNGGDNFLPPSSSRWPKAEVQALIQLRTNMDLKYEESGPKGPLWEDISAAMRKLGYNRNSKRCKEKWENINKYFKKVKESNKKRPEDSKTCPYFHLLDAIYRDKAKTENNNNNTNNSFNPGFGIKPENPMVPIMVRPEQQWPQEPPQTAATEDRDSEDIDEDDDEEEEEDDEGGGYEMVTNKASAVGAVDHE